MESIARICVKNPVATLMAALMFVTLGVVAYRQLPVQLLPDITLPQLGVYAWREKSTGENLEELTKPLEGMLSELPNIKRTRSFTRSNEIWIEATFEQGTDMRFTNLDLEERIAAFRQTLADRRVWIDSFPFSTSEFQASYMFLSVRGDGDADSLFEIARDKVEQQLKAISGVARVNVQGGTNPLAVITIDPDLLANYNLNFGEVISRVNQAAADDAFLGRLNVPGETHFVRLNDRVKTVEELAGVFVDAQGIVPLRAVATVEVGRALDSWIYRADGKNSIGIEMERETSANMIDLAKKTRERIEEINRTLPPGVELIVAEDLAKFVEDAIADVKELALVGAITSLIVPLVFFRSVKVAAIVFLAIPVCLISVFNLFMAAGMSINVFSIIGLSIGVGMVVDNSIVVAENCFRLMTSGKLSARDAAMRGAGEVAKALFASTLTTGIVFLPIIFVDGDFRLFIYEPTLALVFPVIISWIVATTLCPVLIYLLLRSAGAGSLHGGGSWMRDIYRLVQKTAIRRRGLVVIGTGLLILFALIGMFGGLNQTTTSQDANDDFLRMWMQVPKGARLSETDRTVRVVEARLRSLEYIERFSVSFNAESGRFNIWLKELKDRPDRISFNEVRRSILDEIGEVPSAELSLRPLGTAQAQSQTASSILGNEGTLEVKGFSEVVLDPFVERLIDSLRSIPEIASVRRVEERSDPVYLAQFDRERSKLFGIDANLIGQYVGSTRSSGQLSRLVLVDGERRTDVSFVLKGADEGTVDSTKSLPIFSPVGGVTTFGDLTTLRASQTETRVRRTNRQSSAEVAYTWRPGTDVQALSEKIRQVARNMPNPAGVEVSVEGDAAKIDERMQNLAFLTLAGILLVYIVMAAVFESYWVPFVIVMMIPLIIPGIYGAMNLAELPVDDFAAFGGILLIGVVVNSGIVMLDRAMSLMREHGYSRTRAVFSAADSRLRPILMTYLTTAIGLAPMALTGDESSQWRPVAVTIIGGLTSSTLLTLIALPSLFLIGDDFVRWVRPYWFWALAGVFGGVERLANTVSAAIAAITWVPGWRPLTWPGHAMRAVRVVLSVLVWLPGWSWRGLKSAFSTIRAFVVASAGDVVFAARLAFGKGRRAEQSPASAPLAAEEVPGLRAASAGVAGSIDAAPIALSNIQVIYPFGGFEAVRRVLPGNGYGFGRQPAQGLHALKGIDLEIGRGLFGLLGPNGAGKTTLLRCIAGLMDPTRGTVRLFGAAHREAPGALAPLIGYLPQNHGHYESMTLSEYLDYFATLTARTLLAARTLEGTATPAPGVPRALLAERYARLEALEDPAARARAVARAIEEVNLSGHANDRIGGFSGGMKQRAGIARILLQAPPILIVDEPTAGLDPVERVKVRVLLSQLAAERTVLFSTHIVEDLEDTCNAVGILLAGRLLFSGTPEQLQREWEGRVWEVFAESASDADRVRASLVERGARVLFQVARGGREGFRVLAPGVPAPSANPVQPTLEDALLAKLAEGRG